MPISRFINKYLILGVDTTFKETSVTPGESRFDFPYHPRLFGDEDFEEVRNNLRDRIVRETKALYTKEPVLKTYESRVASWRKAFSKVPGLREDPVNNLPPADENAEISRWKIAFRELREKKKGEPPHPTVIVTRDGRYIIILFFNFYIYIFNF